MFLKRINIEGLGGIHNLSLSFNRQMNIICGPNGIGKSTILDAIAHCFAAGSTKTLKRNALAEKSQVTVVIERGGIEEHSAYNIEKFAPLEEDTIYTSLRQDMRKVILFNVNRTFSYAPLNAVSRDEIKQEYQYSQELRGGVGLTGNKNWFVNRYLYSAHKGALNSTQLQNFETARQCFELLDENFLFDGVEPSSNEIMIKTPGGRIYYEYLSSGFKSCLSIMFSIIREVEFRYAFEELAAKDFDGIVLIDEIEVHLHPVWQSKITNILSKLFPNVQFVVTTHSPHVIQSADSNQIIALERHGENICQRELPATSYGFKNWTLDEVLTDVMGMEDTRSVEFVTLLNDFNKALDHENFSKAKEIYEILDGSLHPNNHLRKLLKLQLAEIAHINDKT